MTPFELSENGAPRGLKRALKMHRLHTEQRQRSAAREQTRGTRTRREMNVLLQRAPQPILFVRINLRERHEIAVKHIFSFATQHIGQPARHAGTEIQAERPKDKDHTAGHILAAVLANAFNHGERTAVPHCEAFPGPASNEELPGRGAVKDSVASENVASARSGKPRSDRDCPA